MHSTMKKLLALSGICSVLLINVAFANETTDVNRPRVYTGAPPTFKATSVTCFLRGSSCVSTVNKPSSSSSSSDAYKGKVVSSENSVFVPFLKRFIYVTKEWRGEVRDNTMAVFSRTPWDATSSVGSDFTVKLFTSSECDLQKLEKRQDAAWLKVGKTAPGRVSISRAYGSSGLGFMWFEPGTTGDADRHMCYDPIGHILVVEAVMKASDTKLFAYFEHDIAAQLLRADRTGRTR